MVVPTPDGTRNPLVLAAAHLAGVSRAFTIGGAQAVAALAYGTATIPAVDKICGPGNAYVAAAKRRVFGAVGIDMVAGVSEILVIADGSAHPDWVAMDLFSQAEHDELAQAILVSPDARAARRRRGERAAADRHDAAAGDHRRVVRQPRRADQGPRPRRGLRGVEPRRAGAPRARGRRSAGAAAADPARRRDLHGAPGVRGARRLLRRARTTCCRPAAPRASRRRWASTISRSGRACSRYRRRRRGRSGRWRRRWRTARACRRTRRAPVPARSAGARDERSSRRGSRRRPPRWPPRCCARKSAR